MLVGPAKLAGTVTSMFEPVYAAFADTAVEVLRADRHTAELAQQRLLQGGVDLLGVSGKLASGKDAVAASVMQHLGHDNPLHWSYARPMRGEVDQLIAILSSSPSADAATSRIAEEQGVDEHHARHIAGLLLPALAVTPDLTSWHRTPVMRTVLQYWGTEVRRAQDHDYWVRRALNQVLPAIAEGRTVYFTDLRFPNEVDYPKALGFLTVRISVTEATQAARLRARDGLDPSPETTGHLSETALDDYDGFDLVVDNNGPLEHAVGTIVESMRARR